METGSSNLSDKSITSLTLRSGVAVAMSYDHKPCQLKEKKRIQEAGGFVAMNGVWRVQGVLATSRALGDYPLKVGVKGGDIRGNHQKTLACIAD